MEATTKLFRSGLRLLQCYSLLITCGWIGLVFWLDRGDKDPFDGGTAIVIVYFLILSQAFLYLLYRMKLRVMAPLVSNVLAIVLYFLLLRVFFNW